MAELKDSYDYVIVGAGMAAAKAAAGIHDTDAQGSIAILGADVDPPVYRPDLSKTLWLEDDATLEKSELDLSGADLFTSSRVEAIHPDRHAVTLADGREIGYRKLLLATGSTPRTTDLDAGDRVIYYRTVEDFRRLQDVARPDTHVIVVGGGYIGSEIAAALSQNRVKVTMVLDVELVQQAMFPHDLAVAVTADFVKHGVEIVHGVLDGGAASDESVTVRLEDGTEIIGDAVVIGIGVQPQSGLADAAGLELDPDNGGVVVDEHLATSAPDVYAAGDVASYPDSRLGRRRVEHADNAESMGETAGRSMAGDESYTHTPFFWSDLFDNGYEAIGEVTSSHEMVEDWKDDKPGGTGVVYYLQEGSVRGVLLWNVWDSVPKAQALIEATAATKVDDPDSLKGRIPLG